eukprot:138324-Prorocentrum_lima.AAC.1
MEKDPIDECYVRFVDNVRTDLNAATPINIQGEVFQVCLHCIGHHLAQNRYLFIDLEDTVKKQKQLE